MDYTQQETREQIYRERYSLDEFENDKLGKLNEVLIGKIGTTEVARQKGCGERYTLDIFNNAYYITTLILTDKHPELHIGDFIKIAQTGSWEEHPCKRHFEAVTMGIVSLYMYLCKPMWWEQDDCVLRKEMEDTYTAQYGDDKYGQMLGEFYGDRFFLMAKQDEHVADWFVSDKEPLIAPDEACRVFAPLAEGAATGAGVAESTDVRKLQKRIAELEQEVEELKKPLEGFSADQKVRMEFALRLMEKAGMGENLYKHGNKQKAALFLSTLLDIKNHNARSNEAQTCATYISNRDLSFDRHREYISKLNQLLKDLGIDIEIPTSK